LIMLPLQNTSAGPHIFGLFNTSDVVALGKHFTM
jgi:hypothetical protein